MPQDSTILPQYTKIGIHADHMGMTKFASAEDPGFLAVCGELRRWIKQLGETVIARGGDPSSDPSKVPQNSQSGPDGMKGPVGSQSHAAICK